MPAYPTFQFPSTNVQPNRAFSPADVDFSGIGRLADSYYGAQTGAMERQAYQDDRAAKAAERQRQEEARKVLGQGMPLGADGQPDYYKMAQTIMQYDPSYAKDMMTMGNQDRERAATRAHQDRTFEADQSYRNQQLGLQREQLTPDDVRKYKFYVDQERAAGRDPMSWMDYRKNAASSDFGKTGTIVQGSDGRFYSVQFGSDGKRKVEALEIGAQGDATQSQVAPPVALTPARGVDVVGDTMFNKATGDPLRNVGSSLAGAETAKAAGKFEGEKPERRSKVEGNLRELEHQWGVVSQDIDRAIASIDAGVIPKTGAFSLLGYAPGTPQHDLSSLLDTIRANIGFDKLQTMRENSPTGGALGQVSNFENELLQAVRGSLKQSQTSEQLKQNLVRVRGILEQVRQEKRNAFSRDFGSQNVEQPSLGDPSSLSNDDLMRKLGIGQ